MSAADVAYVVAWEQQTGIKLNLAFNGVGACTAPTAADESSAVCTGSVTDPGGTYADPGQTVDSSYPDDQGLINALLADKADFNWINHTWSHQFLGCIVWQGQALTSATPNATGGTLSAGTYTYEITAATAYGESEPTATPLSATTSGTTGSVTLIWPNATNGTGTNGTAGPTLAAEEANHTGGTGFWGYNVYRENPGSTTFGYIGQVAENGTAPTYTFTDTGATAPGDGPSSTSSTGPFPTATNPGIDCSSAAGSWDPATSTSPDASIEQEIGMDQAFAAANALPNFNAAAVVTGEHSGIESPNMPTALAGNGITTFASDASRQPTQYALGAAESAPRYPSNIYYNASNWPDELNEYNTLYVASGDSLDNATYPTDTGHCDDTSATTCLTTPATESSFLASESRIMLSHVLANNPRVGYAHQTDLIGPATQTVGGTTSDYGYTLLSLINDMLSQYQTWTSTAAPLVQMTDTTEAQVLAEQSAWAAAQTAGTGQGHRAERSGHRDQLRHLGRQRPLHRSSRHHHRGRGLWQPPMAGPCPPGPASPPVGPWSSPRTRPRPSPRPPTRHLHRGGRLHRHGDHHRYSGSGPDRDRGPAHRAHLRRQRQRDRHHLGHPGGRLGGASPSPSPPPMPGGRPPRPSP